MTSITDHSPTQRQLPWPAFVDELTRRTGIPHIKTIDELACARVFHTDEEVEELLA